MASNGDDESNNWRVSLWLKHDQLPSIIAHSNEWATLREEDAAQGTYKIDNDQSQSISVDISGQSTISFFVRDPPEQYGQFVQRFAQGRTLSVQTQGKTLTMPLGGSAAAVRWVYACMGDYVGREDEDELMEGTDENSPEND